MVTDRGSNARPDRVKTTTVIAHRRYFVPTVCLFVAVLGMLYRECQTRRAFLALGERLYREQSCLVCHGAEGRGNGPRAGALDPPPRDFTLPSAYVQGRTAADIAETLKRGVFVHPSQMPSFAHLSERERLALGEFIVSLQR